MRNRIHGCNPSPGAFTGREGRILKLWRAEVTGKAAGDAPPGMVVAVDSDLQIAASDGLVRLLEVQPESRARMSGAEFVRGYRVLAGERWMALPARSAAG